MQVFEANPTYIICTHLCPISTRTLTPNIILAKFRNLRKHTARSRAAGVILKTCKMTVASAKGTPSVEICDADGGYGSRGLVVRGKTLLRGVPDGVVVKPLESGSAFVGASADSSSSRHVFTLGVLEAYKLLCLFRFNIWWMIPKVGRFGSDIPLETQMLLLEARKDVIEDEKMDSTIPGNTFYILILPVLDGNFRSSLQGNSANELQFCVESGDLDIQTSEAFESVFINSGDNPFELMRDSIMILAKNKGTFSHIENKKIPASLDWFGWCTWDAFYTDVDPVGIMEGLQSLSEGGTPPRFLIIDDGWQETINEYHKEGEPLIEGTQFATRLVSIKENQKFADASLESKCKNLKQFIGTIKERFGLKYVYMWHALAGYWGGILPTSEEMKKYNPTLKYPVQSPGNTGNIRDIAMDSLEKYGVGVIDPSKIHDFYSDLHSYLSNSGVDGVKVDVQNLIETVGYGLGGRVSLTRKYQQALEESITKIFRENNLICCMSHNSDSIYSSKTGAVARASEDFMPREPTLQTLHIASVSFNSLLLGEIVKLDWDMFLSDHATAEFHAVARALGGCSVYVSDKPGNHNFNILRKLVLPDGSVLRAKYAGRPTRDCLFKDPVMDGESLLKIWNFNKFSGVVGVFNCQGSGRWPLMDNSASVSNTLYISGHVSPSDVEFLEEHAGENWTGDCAVFAINSGDLSRVPHLSCLDVSLSTIHCEIFTISPIKAYDQKIHFAPLGLIDMYNSGGAIESLESILNSSECVINIGSKGPGRFGAYSNMRPKRTEVGDTVEEFSYDSRNSLLIINLSESSGENRLWDIKIFF